MATSDKPLSPTEARNLGTTQAQQLLALEDAAKGDPVAHSKRRAVLMEWFQKDFAAAMAYCQALGYEDLNDPELIAFMARTANVDQLVDVISKSPLPFEVTRSICEGAGVEKVRQLMDTAGRYQGVAAMGFVSAVSTYLTEKNIDAAIAFAGSIENDGLRASALAGVVNQLSTEGKNSEVQFLYETLDQKLRETDPVKFAYGQSLHDADPETAIALLYGIQDAVLKQVALLSFAHKVQSNQPAIAVQAIQASGISVTEQTQQMERILGDWVVFDKEAAAEYLNTAESLPADLRARLQAKVK
ncbi:hypothetical protein [Oleiharenicola lentus]|uniref:hypothetical protein n=1 Tax=Oleiharenicola lentus TaxID=2508720 RepID=UPI003F6743AF